MDEGAGAQLLHSLEPVNLRRPLRAAPSFPELVRKGFSLRVSEGCNAWLRRSCMRIPMRTACVLIGLAGLLVSGQMLLLVVLFGNAMGVGGAVLLLGRALMVFVMRSVVMTSRHSGHLTCKRYANLVGGGALSKDGMSGHWLAQSVNDDYGWSDDLIRSLPNFARAATMIQSQMK